MTNRILANGVEIPEQDDFIWREYNDKCIMCVYRPAVCLHECPYKSHNKNWREQPWTRWPVCNQHHEQLHGMNWKAQLNMLNGQRNAYFPNAYKNLGGPDVSTDN